MIVSSQSPHKRLDPTTDDGRSRLQIRIDSMADVFIETIARNRNVSAENVQNHYGGGDVMIGAKAVSAGLADRIGSLEGLIAELSSPQKSPRTEGFFNAQSRPCWWSTMPARPIAGKLVSYAVSERPVTVRSARGKALPRW